MAFYKLGTREGGVNPTGNAVEANVLKDKTFSNASGINKIGTMPDNSTTTSNGTVPGINSSYPNIPIRPGSNLQMGVNTDGVKQLALEPPQGYYPGGGSSYIGVDADDLGDAVASDVVSGKTFTSKSGIEVVGTRENSGTYTASSRNAALDMGNPNTYRYVNTNGVPNSNSGTYTFPANDTGGTKDLGETNTYRYVNATNVYNKGKADWGTSVTGEVIVSTSPVSLNTSGKHHVLITLIYYSFAPDESMVSFSNLTGATSREVSKLIINGILSKTYLLNITANTVKFYLSNPGGFYPQVVVTYIN